MPWQNDPDKRRRDRETYEDPEFIKNRAIVRRRANGRCERCGRTGRRIQVDHVVPRSQGGGHGLDNLQALCSGPGSCHAAKTARESHATRRPERPAPTPRTVW